MATLSLTLMGLVITIEHYHGFSHSQDFPGFVIFYEGLRVPDVGESYKGQASP